MPRYGSRELLDLLLIKPHVLRYWEQQLPLIRSDRDETGHRIWTSAQVRLLRRLRYLVVGRGLSVQAAGEMLLREGETTPANVKAGLDSVREELLATLHRIRVGRDAGDGSAVAGTVAGAAAFAFAGAATHTPAVTVTENTREGTRELPVSMIPPPGPDSVRSGSPPTILSHRNRIAPSGPSEIPMVPVVYRHLYAYAASDRANTDTTAETVIMPGSDPAMDPIPALLCRILVHRLPEGSSPVVVCVPPGAIRSYRHAFEGYSDLARRALFLEVPRFEYRNANWFAPTLGALYTFVSPEAVRGMPSLHSFRRFYFWAADSPDSPPPGEVHCGGDHQSRGDDPVVTLMLHERGGDSVVGESFLLDIPGGYGQVSPRMLSSYMYAGRWSVGAVRPGTFDQRASHADITGQGWRYDLWVRDLAAAGAPWFVVPGRYRPTLWRGYDWRSQIPAVWPEIV